MSNQPNQSSKQQNQPHKHHHKHQSNLPFNPSFFGAILGILMLSALFIYEFLIVSQPSYWVPCLVIFLFFLCMVYWSYFSTVCNDPGRVPFYYGLSNEIGQSVRKYCLLCHNFKPQRTHHCSHCKRCVLNMDHHCPWINNCVGFRNRKFFLLFLIYISLGLIFMSVIEVICMVGEITKIIQTKQAGFHFALKLILTLITVTLAFMLTFFGLYHLKMVCRNTTSLEQMTLKKGNTQEQNGNFRFYDAGLSQNMEQVFGENKLLWGIPIYGNGPKRNGTSWPVGGPRNVKLYEPLAGNQQQAKANMI